MKVLKFGAVWCPGCLVMKPRWQEIEKELSWLETEYYDIDKDQEMAEKYKIESDIIPAFIFLDKNNKEIKRLNGEIEKDKLIEICKKYKDY